MSYDSLRLRAMDVTDALREVRAGARPGRADIMSSIDDAIVSIPAAILAADLALQPSIASTDLSRCVSSLAQVLADVDYLEHKGLAPKGPVGRARVAITEMATATMSWNIHLVSIGPIQGEA